MSATCVAHSFVVPLKPVSGGGFSSTMPSSSDGDAFDVDGPVRVLANVPHLL